MHIKVPGGHSKQKGEKVTEHPLCRAVLTVTWLVPPTVCITLEGAEAQRGPRLLSM